MKEDWTEQLRKKLEGHEATPPEGLWEDICKEMGLTSAPASKPATHKRLYWAAAILLALVGFFAYYHFDDSKISLQTNNTPTQTSDTPLQANELQSPAEPQQTITSPVLAKHTNEALTETSPLVTENEEETTENKENVTVNQEDTTVIHQKAETKQPMAITSHQPEPLYEVVSQHSTREGKWSVGLNASSGLLAANNPDQINNLQSQINAYEYAYSANTYYTWQHRLPVRLGLSVQYQLNGRLALLSGINYTYLYSECTIPQYQDASYNQKLHYLGIPLGLSWQVWSTKNFHFYLSGNVMLEKCISSKVSKQTVQTGNSPKPWQCSVQAAAGAEYLLAPQFGIYLEPALGYYFNDGSSLQHYYKEHPLAPSLEFGLRLHLKK